MRTQSQNNDVVGQTSQRRILLEKKKELEGKISKSSDDSYIVKHLWTYFRLTWKYSHDI